MTERGHKEEGTDSGSRSDRRAKLAANHFLKTQSREKTETRDLHGEGEGKMAPSPERERREQAGRRYAQRRRGARGGEEALMRSSSTLLRSNCGALLSPPNSLDT